MDTRVEPGQVREDRFTGTLERQTAKAPSSLFLGLAIASMAASAVMKIRGKDDWALFIGQWASSTDQTQTVLTPYHALPSHHSFLKQGAH